MLLIITKLAKHRLLNIGTSSPPLAVNPLMVLGQGNGIQLEWFIQGDVQKYRNHNRVGKKSLIGNKT